MDDNCFYFIKEEYFSKFSFSKTSIYQNKDSGFRPHYYCFPDTKYDYIYWLIPVSSEDENYLPRIERIKATNSKHECDIYYATKIFSKQEYMSTFLIGNMIPVSQDYIEQQYKIFSKPVELLNSIDQAAVSKRAKKVLAMIKRNVPFLKDRPNVEDIIKILISEHEQAEQEKQTENT